MKKVGVGVAGVGFIGAVHIEALKRLSNVEVKAVCDPCADIAEKAERMGIENAYADFSEMLKSDIDCVHICTPNHLHFEMVQQALNAGKHVICEKPLAMDAGEAKELARLAKEKKRFNATNFNIRFYPLMFQLKAMTARGELGDVFCVSGSYLQDWLFYETDYNWRLEAVKGGKSRVLADIGSHWFDLIEFVTGLRVTDVCADFATFHKTRKKPLKEVETYSGKMLTPSDYADGPIQTEDYASVLFRLSNGGRGTVMVSQAFAGMKNRVSFDLSGSKKSASWHSERPNEMIIGRRDAPNELFIRDPSLFYGEAAAVASYPGGHNEGYPDTFKQLFKKAYEAIQAGDFDNAWLPGFDAGVREMSLLDKMIESYETGRWITVENEGE